jgi:hypothetical protein
LFGNCAIFGGTGAGYLTGRDGDSNGLEGRREARTEGYKLVLAML